MFEPTMNIRLASRVFAVCMLLVANATVCEAKDVLMPVSSGREYTVSPIPDYLAYPPSTVRQVLTDGKYAKGLMWVSQDALTWRAAKRVTFDLTLDKPATIQEIVVHVAAGSGGVHFPSSMFVYLSMDGKNYSYAGDLMAEGPIDESSGYVAKFVKLSNINTVARYVKAVVMPTPTFFSMDEVEVLAGPQAHSVSAKGNIQNIEKDVTARNISNLTPRYERQDNLALTAEGASAGGSAAMRRVRLLQRRFPGQSVLVEPTSPWSSASPLAIPAKVAQMDEFKAIVPQGACEYRAFVATNASEKVEPLTFVASPVSETVKLDVSEALEVRDGSGRSSFDALTPASTGITLEPGQSRFVMMSMCGQKPGAAQFQLAVKKGGEQIYVVKADLSVVELGERATALAATTWSYLTNKNLKDQSKAVLDDLVSHHENIIVVPMDTLGATPGNGIASLDDYLAPFGTDIKSGKFKKVLIFLPLKGKNSARLDSSVWKAGFSAWYDKVSASLVSHGFQRSQIYLYPYDEPSGPVIAQAAAFYKWFKSTNPNAQIFVTLDTISALKLQQFADISCVARGFIAMAAHDGHGLWLYNATGPAKTNDVYGYYRLLPWAAVDNGAMGVGFWSYSAFADSDSRGLNDHPGASINYSPIYLNENGSLMSSRRWEAWRAGLEDAALVRLLAKMKGSTATARYVHEVLNSVPSSQTGADVIRQRIIKDLLKMP